MAEHKCSFPFFIYKFRIERDLSGNCGLVVDKRITWHRSILSYAYQSLLRLWHFYNEWIVFKCFRGKSPVWQSIIHLSITTWIIGSLYFLSRDFYLGNILYRRFSVICFSSDSCSVLSATRASRLFAYFSMIASMLSNMFGLLERKTLLFLLQPMFRVFIV